MRLLMRARRATNLWPRWVLYMNAPHLGSSLHYKQISLAFALLACRHGHDSKGLAYDATPAMDDVIAKLRRKGYQRIRAVLGHCIVFPTFNARGSATRFTSFAKELGGWAGLWNAVQPYQDELH